MPKYRYVGDHADTVYKGEQVIPVAPGDYVELTAKEMENEANKELDLIEVKEGK